MQTHSVVNQLLNIHTTTANVSNEDKLAEKPYQITLSDLKFGDELGAGAFASVKSVFYNNKEYAAKIYKYNATVASNDNHANEIALSNFKRQSMANNEIDILYILGKKNLPNVMGLKYFCYEKINDYQWPYIITDAMKNGDLFDYLTNCQQSLSWKNKINFMLDAATAVVSLHENNIVHRDIKTENYLLTDFNFHLKLADFGSAIQINNADDVIEDKTIHGTAQVIAPETLNKNCYSKATDIYQLGWTLFDIATNGKESPFANFSDNEIVALRKYNFSLAEFPNDCPKKISALIKNCWDTQSQKRPDATEVVNTLLKVNADMKRPKA